MDIVQRSRTGEARSTLNQARTIPNSFRLPPFHCCRQRSFSFLVAVARAGRTAWLVWPFSSSRSLRFFVKMAQHPKTKIGSSAVWVPVRCFPTALGWRRRCWMPEILIISISSLSFAPFLCQWVSVSQSSVLSANRYQIWMFCQNRTHRSIFSFRRAPQ